MAQVTEQVLSAEYGAWLKQHGVAEQCAEDHLVGSELTPEQREWLADFTTRWDAMRVATDPQFADIVLMLDTEAARLGLEGLDAEGCLALKDATQAFAMLDDMEARCGMNVENARIGLSKEHFWYLHNPHVHSVAQDLVERYNAIGDASGEATHAAMAVGALEAEFNPNTGGHVWLSYSLHATPVPGVRLLASAGNDDVYLYAVPASFGTGDDGRSALSQMVEHVARMCGEDSHLLVTSAYFEEP